MSPTVLRDDCAKSVLSPNPSGSAVQVTVPERRWDRDTALDKLREERIVVVQRNPPQEYVHIRWKGFGAQTCP